MTSIKNVLSLIAAIPTLTPQVAHAPPTGPGATVRQCGEVNVFYTGFPPYHPLTLAQGWDPVRVEAGLRNETVNLIKTGYNVHVVWAGLEVPLAELEKRIDQTGGAFDIAAIGFGMRGATLEPIVERFEDLVELFNRKLPTSRKVFNHDPESLLWSVTHRMPMAEDCQALNKPGKLLGYEEICDARCDRDLARIMGHKLHDEL